MRFFHKLRKRSVVFEMMKNTLLFIPICKIVAFFSLIHIYMFGKAIYMWRQSNTYYFSIISELRKFLEEIKTSLISTVDLQTTQRC